MRFLAIGLSAALALTGLAAATATYAAKDAVIDTVTPLTQAAGLTCAVSAARAGADVMTADKSAAKIYEVACQDGSGYVLIAKTKSTEAPTVYTCLQAAAPGADGKPTALACKLPANANPQLGIQPLVAQAGRSCAVDRARVIGMGATQTYYEVACKDGSDMILATPTKPGAGPTTTTSCLLYGSDSKVQCTLTTREQQLAFLDGLGASTGKCTVKDKRYVATDTAGTDYFEVSCTSGKGYVLHTDQQRKLKETIDCAVAGGIAGGCTLTDSRAALTQQNALYSTLAKKAGFDCTVTQYAPYVVSGNDNEVVELKCSNRPDGGVGLFPLHGGQPRVLDCARASAEGYICSFTKLDAVYPKLTAQLRKLGKNLCAVSGARGFGSNASTDFVEVACADGGLGWVIEYPKASDTAASLDNCAQAASFGAGGCQLPTNIKK